MRRLVLGLLVLALFGMFIYNVVGYKGSGDGPAPIKYAVSNGAGDSNAEPIQEDSEFGAGDSCAKIKIILKDFIGNKPTVDEDSEF